MIISKITAKIDIKLRRNISMLFVIGFLLIHSCCAAFMLPGRSIAD